MQKLIRNNGPDYINYTHFIKRFYVVGFQYRFDTTPLQLHLKNTFIIISIYFIKYSLVDKKQTLTDLYSTNILILNIVISYQ